MLFNHLLLFISSKNLAIGYLNVKEKLLLVENDNRPNELRDAANIIVSDEEKKMIISKYHNVKKYHAYYIYKEYLLSHGY